MPPPSSARWYGRPKLTATRSTPVVMHSRSAPSAVASRAEAKSLSMTASTPCSRPSSSSTTRTVPPPLVALHGGTPPPPRRHDQEAGAHERLDRLLLDDAHGLGRGDEAPPA